MWAGYCWPSLLHTRKLQQRQQQLVLGQPATVRAHARPWLLLLQQQQQGLLRLMPHQQQRQCYSAAGPSGQQPQLQQRQQAVHQQVLLPASIRARLPQSP